MPENGNRKLEGLRILVAEDAVHITLAIEAALEAEGAGIAGVAGTLEAALKCARNEKPDLAIVDLHLGDEPALPLIRELREAGIKVVVATGFDLEGEQKEELKALPVLRKPYTADQLVKLVRSML